MPPTEKNTPVTPIYQRQDEGMGPVIGAIVVVILLVFGALYFWGQKLNASRASDTPVIPVQQNA